MAPRVLNDLQRFIAFGLVPDLDANGDIQFEAVPSQEELLNFKTTVALAASARVNLLCRPPGTLRPDGFLLGVLRCTVDFCPFVPEPLVSPCFAARTLWLHVTELSKRAMDGQAAIQQASGVLANLNKLVEFLDAQSKSTADEIGQTDWRLHSKACCRCLDVSTACKGSVDPAAGEAAMQLEAKCVELQDLLGKAFLGTDSFDVLLQSLWGTEGSFDIPESNDACPDVKQVLIHMMLSGGACAAISLLLLMFTAAQA